MQEENGPNEGDEAAADPTETEEVTAVGTAPLASEDRWEEFARITSGALNHMIESGEVPEFIGHPMEPEDALNFLKTWLDTHRPTLIEGGVDFLTAIARRFAEGDGPDQSIEEFEAGLVSLTDEQLTAISEAEADAAEAMKRDVIDRRREMVADAMAVGKVLLRGALATGLTALLAAV